jgi:Caspase domain
MGLRMFVLHSQESYLRRILLFAIIALVSLSVGRASAERRVALIIGNSAYQNVAQLTNPANDAAVITDMFKKASFEVVESRRDLKNVEMRRALREFTEKTRDADIAIVYYAGHGIEVDGTNYLIPIDASLQRDTDVYDEAISLDRILQAIEPAKQLRLVILDACRDNPFGKMMKRTLASRSVGRGLAGVEPSSPNTLIAFAAKGGSTAFDGDSKNSPFTIALASHLTVPGLELRKAFGLIRDDVMNATRNKQEPFVYGSLGGTDVVLVPQPQAVTTLRDGTNVGTETRHDYELAAQVGTKEAWDSFLVAYSSGFYADLARAQRNKLAAEVTRVAATEKSRLATEEKVRLAAEGAKANELAKATARVKAAEEARLAAENAKKLDEVKVAVAEQAKTASEDRSAALEKAATEKAETVDKNTKILLPDVAVLTPPASIDPVSSPVVVSEKLNRELQTELHRVGCHTGTINDEWDTASRRAIEQFNKSAGLKLDVQVASLDSLDAVRDKTARICPLICQHGYKANGDKCIGILCKKGFEIGEDNNCERIEVKKANKPIAKLTLPGAGAQRSTSTTSITTPGMGSTCSSYMNMCNGQRRGWILEACRTERTRCMKTGVWTHLITGRGFSAERR